MGDKDKKKEELEKKDEKLKPCTSASNPEMVRNEDEDEPCDDSRSG